MKKLGYITIAAGIALVLGLLVLRQDSNSPTGVARRVITALEHHDEAGLRSAFCQTQWGSIIGQGEVRFNGMAYHARQTGDTAEVTITGRVISDTNTLPINWTLSLRQQQGRWCVASLINNAAF